MSETIISGTYSHFQILKTRKVAQMVIEFPIEQGEQFISKFGLPNTHEEKWVAVAWLRSQPVETNGKASRAIQQAGIMCKDIAFGTWLRDTRKFQINPANETEVQEVLRAILGVTSRADMRTNDDALERWETLYEQFKRQSEAG